MIKPLLINLGCWKGNSPNSSVHVLKIWKKAITAVKIRLFKKRPVLKNL
jgi:hypothetical protein